MSDNISKKKEQMTVSQIVNTIDNDGRPVLGFTVYCGEDSFYNVMRSYSAEDYAEVLLSLQEQRRQLMDNQKQGEKNEEN
jgi:hypothetical protein